MDLKLWEYIFEMFNYKIRQKKSIFSKLQTLTPPLSERQLEKRKTICKLLLERCERKSFVHRIMTGDEKWVYCKNPKRQKAWVLPGEPGPKRQNAIFMLTS